jgi:SAM-dependent methyltransferase
MRILGRRIRLWGWQFRCPFCRGRYRTLMPRGRDHPVFAKHRVIGSGRRLGACPICRSTDRERLLYLYLSRETDVFRRTLRLLHLAPEPQLGPRLRETLGDRYVSADIQPRDVRMALDVTGIPIRDATFDVILCCHVLEHVVDDRRAMGELRRVLRPDGWAILQVPFSPVLAETREDAGAVTPEQRRAAFGQTDHVRIYGRDYVRRLEGCGFVVELLDYAGQLGPATTRSYGLNPEEPLFVCRPRPPSAP